MACCSCSRTGVMPMLLKTDSRTPLFDAMLRNATAERARNSRADFTVSARSFFGIEARIVSSICTGQNRPTYCSRVTCNESMAVDRVPPTNTDADKAKALAINGSTKAELLCAAPTPITPVPNVL